MRHMVLDGARRDEDRLTDLDVRLALEDESGDLTLTLAELGLRADGGDTGCSAAPVEGAGVVPKPPEGNPPGSGLAEGIGTAAGAEGRGGGSVAASGATFCALPAVG